MLPAVAATETGRTLTTTREWTTFASAFESRRNSYGFLRLVFAIGVVLAHTVPLGGLLGGRDVRTPRSHVDLGVMCVYGFLVLSGVLITRSAERIGTVRFFWHRLLRILPGFWATLLGTGLVCAPLAYAYQHGSLAGFFAAPDGPVQYLRADWLLVMGQYSVSGTPADVPFPLVWAGSLYTLVVEFRCYVVLGLLGLLGVLRRERLARCVLLAGAVGSWSFMVVVEQTGRMRHLVPYLQTSNSRAYATFFALGATAWVWRRRLPMAPRWASAVGVATAFALGLGELPWQTVGVAGFAYLVLWTGLNLPEACTRWNTARPGSPDISYGIYTWGVPVQQLIVVFGLAGAGWPLYTLESLAGAVLLGLASWYGIEQRALRLKDWSFGVRGARRPDARSEPSRSR